VVLVVDELSGILIFYHHVHVRSCYRVSLMLLRCLLACLRACIACDVDVIHSLFSCVLDMRNLLVELDGLLCLVMNGCG